MSSYSHPHSLDGHVTIVTGAARGVGKGIATALLSRGARVLVTDILDDVLANTTAEFAEAGFDVASLVADLRDPDSAQRIVDAALDAFGTVDGLVNNAVASSGPIPFVDIPADEYERVHDTGPRATFRLMQAIHPVMVEGGGGSIVNLGSGTGTEGKPFFGAYASAKEAIRGMSKVAALEWGRDNIRVNVVCPFANSEGVQGWSQAFPDDYGKSLKRVPLQRVGDTHTDIGATVAFLIGPDASYLTAQTIHLDGGTGTFR